MGTVNIVSGLPRSGTSMMMNMLQAGGMDLLVDHVRKPDVDNPGGYFEFEKVKKVKKDASWLEQAPGKAVKVISRLLGDLPPRYLYKVIFMQRSIDEVLASQHQMLRRLGRVDEEVDDQAMRDLFIRHLHQVQDWVERQENFEIISIDYNQVLAHPPEQSHKVNQFLERELDEAGMAAIVDQKLYRQRRWQFETNSP